MAEHTVKVDISFQSLLEAISSLGIAEKHQLWELLEAELFPDDEDSTEDIAEIQAARADSYFRTLELLYNKPLMTPMSNCENGHRNN